MTIQTSINKCPRLAVGDKINKIMSSDKITLEQFNDPAFIRSEQMKVKSEATWVAFLELDGIINKSKLAEKYFHRSQSWFSQKLNGNAVNNKDAAFTEDDYKKLTASFRDIAKNLNNFADAIDKAEM